MELSMPDAHETMKVKLFYYLNGETGRELCETLMSDVLAARRTVKDMMEKFDGHCNPKVNETVEISLFHEKSETG